MAAAWEPPPVVLAGGGSARGIARGKAGGFPASPGSLRRRGCEGTRRRRSPFLFGACAGEGGCGNRRLHWAVSLCPPRSLGDCDGLGPHRSARRVRRIAILAKNERLVTLLPGERGCGLPVAGITGVVTRAVDDAHPVSREEVSPTFHFWPKNVSGACSGCLDGLILSYEGEHDGGRGMMHVHLGTVGKCSEFAAIVVEDQA